MVKKNHLFRVTQKKLIRKIGEPILFRCRSSGILFVTFILGILLGGCTHAPPVGEYTLSREAIQASLKAEAGRYAPSYLHRAEEAFRKGQQEYENKSYQEAEDQFIKARVFAERAENIARAQKFENGD